MRCTLLLSFIALVSLAEGAKLPATFKICKRTDPKISECFQDAVQDALPKLKDGIPELNFAPLEPVVIANMKVDAGTGAMNVVQKFENIKISNVTSATVEKSEIKIDGDKFSSTLAVHLPQTSADSDYDFDGKILMLPIKGAGKCHMVLENVKITMTMHGIRYDKKGVSHLKVTDANVDFEPDAGSFHFDNLFNGDERLATEMNNLINENWKDLFNDVRGAYEDTLGNLLKGATNSIFSKVALDDLFPE